MPVALQEDIARAQDALGIKTTMGVEVLVFGRDEGALDERRDRRRGQIQASLTRIFREQAAVGRMNPGHHRRLVVLELRIVRQILLVLENHTRNHGRADQEQDRARGEKKTEKPADGAHIKSQCRRRECPRGAPERAY